MMEQRAAQRKDRLLFFLCLASFLLLLAFPAVTGAGVRAGLDLCYRAVIPSVFPSLVLTELLFSRPLRRIERTLGRLFHSAFGVSPRGAVAWIAGLLSGFPVGAVTVAADVREGRLSREEGEYLLSFVNNTGPAFLVGGIGLGLFGSVRLGWTLYLLQIPVSLAVALLFRPKRPFPTVVSAPSVPAHADPVRAIVRAAETCVRIAGFVCIFSVATSLLSAFFSDGLPLAFLSSLLEVGNGAHRAAILPFPFPAFPLLAFSVCFSGLSVHFQTLSVLKEAGIPTATYLKGKTASGALAFLLSLLLSLTK